MEKPNLVEIPGTGTFVDLGYVEHDLSDVLGTPGKSVRVPKKLPPHLTEVAAGDPRAMLWRLADFPPTVEPAGMILLGRALRQLGSVLIGEQWTGFEFAANRTLDEMPTRAPSDEAMIKLAYDLLGKKWLGRGSAVTDADWARAVGLREEALSMVRPARERAAKVIGEIEVRLASGDLTAQLHPKQGGALEVARPASDWLVPRDTLIQRILTCSMDPAKPFARDGFSHWIYLQRQSFDALLAAIRKREASDRTSQPPRILAFRSAFVERVKDAVRARPGGPSERAERVREGREIYRLSKQEADAAFKEAVDTAGIPHAWSQRGPKKSTD